MHRKGQPVTAIVVRCFIETSECAPRPAVVMLRRPPPQVMARTRILTACWHPHVSGVCVAHQTGNVPSCTLLLVRVPDKCSEAIVTGATEHVTLILLLHYNALEVLKPRGRTSTCPLKLQMPTSGNHAAYQAFPCFSILELVVQIPRTIIKKQQETLCGVGT